MLTLFALLLVLLLLGIPVFAATGLAALFYILWNGLPALVIDDEMVECGLEEIAEPSAIRTSVLEIAANQPDRKLLVEFVGRVRPRFAKVRLVKPKASRAESSEMYLLARQHRM